MIPPITTATTGPVPPLPGGGAAGVTVASVDRGPPAVSTCTATVAGSRAGAGNVSRYRVPSAAVTWSNAPMTPEGPAVTAIPPVPSATAVQNGDAVSPDPTTASTTPAARIRSTTVAAGSPPASGAPV